jgi:GAF domain-containing protein
MNGTNGGREVEASSVRRLSEVAGGSFVDVHDAAQAIFGLIHEVVGMRICVLTKIDLETNELTVLEAFDRVGLGVTAGMRMPADQMPCACVMRSGGALREYDLEAHPAFRELPITTKMGLRSYVGVPLRRSDGTLWGTLAATDTEVLHASDSDIEMLTVLARLASFEFEREEQQKALADTVRMQTVLEAAAAVSHEVNSPLTVLAIRLSRLKSRYASGDPATKDDLDAALEAAEEILQVTQRLRGVVRPVTTRYWSQTRMLDLRASAVESDDDTVSPS